MPLALWNCNDTTPDFDNVPEQTVYSLRSTLLLLLAAKGGQYIPDGGGGRDELVGGGGDCDPPRRRKLRVAWFPLPVLVVARALVTHVNPVPW